MVTPRGYKGKRIVIKRGSGSRVQFLLTEEEEVMRERDREINRRRHRKEKAQKARKREAIENAKKAAAGEEKIMPGRAFWLTGLPGSGKSTLALAAKKAYPEIVLLQMDEMRKIVTPSRHIRTRSASCCTWPLSGLLRY